MPYLRLRDLTSNEMLEYEVSEIRMGRDPDFELVVYGTGAEVVSGRHARLVDRGGAWWLEDLGSRNGTFLSGRRLAVGASEQLSSGAEISLGERGPRFRVEAVQKRRIADTVVEGATAVRPSAATVPMPGLADTAPSKPPETAPSPASGRRPQTVRLVVMEARSGEQFRASGGRIRVGRGKECELRPVGPDDTSVSRVHAEIVLKPDGTVVIRDAQSRNGTFVQGVRLAGEQELGRGDRVQLGPDGPELVVLELAAPGPAPQAEPEKPKEAARPAAAARAAEKMGAVRRSFGGKGATVFFSEMFHETSKKSARRVRFAIWSAVVVIVAGVAAGYWYKDRLEQQLDQRLAVQQALADSIRDAASSEYERLRAELQAARESSAPAAFVESLRVALEQAEQRTTQLEVALERAQSSLNRQLAAGDSIRRQAQAELARLQRDLERARSTGTSQALLDSLRAAVQAAEDRASAVASQMRAVRGSNLAAVSQANQGAVGLVTAYVGAEVFDGSGFALTESGYFVTNRHVVQPRGRPRADSVYVTLADQRVMRRAQVAGVASAAGPDLAVLKIMRHDGSHVARVDWSGANVRQGEPAALIGFPAGFGNAIDAATGMVRTSMSAGIFSKVTPDVINFDGFTIGGSSGSPIFNANGEVVAVHYAGLTEAVGLGFAVPIPKLLALLPPDAKRELGLP